MSNNNIKQRIVVSLLATSSSLVHAETQEAVILDDIAVTATREARPTKNISQNIAVIDDKRIDEYNPTNITQLLRDIPGVTVETTSGGYSSDLYIRGSGVRAPFGVREIMVIRDGIPITDPDSSSRFDFIDMQDIQQMEVTKGPGSIYAAGTTGGVVQILSKSVFDPESRLKIGYGTYDQMNMNSRLAFQLGQSDFFAITLSHKQDEANWRVNNAYYQDQASVKYGHLFDDNASFESEFSYTKARLQLPARVSEEEYQEYRRTGRQALPLTYQWQQTARDSDIYFINTKYTKEWGDFVFTPRAYLNYWQHWHPVTGQISDRPDNLTVGTDLEGKWHHQLFGNEASLIAGFTIRNDSGVDGRSWAYADVDTTRTNVARFGPPRYVDVINYTRSNQPGELLSTTSSNTMLYGGYLQETFKPVDRLTIDASFRYDRIRLQSETFKPRKYDFSTRAYVDVTDPAERHTSVDQSFHVFSSRFGAAFEFNQYLSSYLNFGYGGQVPNSSEIESNVIQDFGGLELAHSYNYEIGLKGRGEHFYFDTSFYYNPMENEIVNTTVLQNGQNVRVFQNAGETEKLGFEFSGEWEILPEHLPGLWLGANYSYSDYQFVEFSEPVGFGPTASNVDRSGNQFPKIPKHYYTLSARYSHPNGFFGSLRTRTKEAYYIDNDNSLGKAGAYRFVTDLSFGYRYQEHSLQLNIYNMFNKRYAVEVADGTTPYRLASPLTAMVTYQYNFEL